MLYRKEYVLKDHTKVLVRNGEYEDGESVLSVFKQVSTESENIGPYLEEIKTTTSEESLLLDIEMKESRDAFLVAEYDNKIVGMISLYCVRERYKTKHRATFGLSILKEYSNLGIGSALLRSCITCAKQAGYKQLELDVVEDNKPAYHLYQKFGFQEYGRNQKGFYLKDGTYHCLILMSLDLEDE